MSSALGGDLPKRFEKELSRLRRGGGVYALDSPDRLGPLLGEMLHRQGPVDEDFREVVADLLMTALATQQQQSLVAIAYGATRRSAGRTLTERLTHLGRAMDRDLRTVQRRVDELSKAMAGNLATRLGDLRSRPAFFPAGWTLDRFTGRLSFTGSRPRLVEEREVVSRQMGLEDIEINVSLLGREPGPDDVIAVTALDGCAVKEVSRFSSRFWTIRLALPRPLDYGARHRMVVEHVIPHRDNLDPAYGMAAYRSCRRFEAFVTFAHPDDVRAVWSFTGLPQTMLEHYGPAGAEAVGLDDTNTAAYEADHLVQGLCYGLGWQWREPPGDSDETTDKAAGAGPD